MSTFLALGVKNVLGSGTIFQTLRFSTIISEILVLQQRIQHHRVSLVETTRVISHFQNKKKNSKFDPTNLGSQVRLQVKVGHIGYHSIRGHKANTLVI